MSLAGRTARAISRRQIPVPSGELRPHSRSPVSNLRRSQRVFHLGFPPDRSQFSTHAGTQAPGILTTSGLARNEDDRYTIPRGVKSCNTADRIEEELLEKGHRVWGFVIYRCTYGDDAAW